MSGFVKIDKALPDSIKRVCRKLTSQKRRRFCPVVVYSNTDGGKDVPPELVVFNQVEWPDGSVAIELESLEKLADLWTTVGHTFGVVGINAKYVVDRPRLKQFAGDVASHLLISYSVSPMTFPTIQVVDTQIIHRAAPGEDPSLEDVRSATEQAVKKAVDSFCKLNVSIVKGV